MKTSDAKCLSEDSGRIRSELVRGEQPWQQAAGSRQQLSFSEVRHTLTGMLTLSALFTDKQTALTQHKNPLRTHTQYGICESFSVETVSLT